MLKGILMNLAIRGISGTIALGNSFHDDKFKSLRADYVLANPPFNISKWRGGLLQDDGEPFADKMTRLAETLDEQFAASAQLEQAIRQNLQGLGDGDGV